MANIVKYLLKVGLSMVNADCRRWVTKNETLVKEGDGGQSPRLRQLHDVCPRLLPLGAVLARLDYTFKSSSNVDDIFRACNLYRVVIDALQGQALPREMKSQSIVAEWKHETQ